MAVIDPGRPPRGIRVRDLGPGDIDASLALSGEAGWNQTAEDWAWMIGHGRGWACLDTHDRVVATALTQPQMVSDLGRTGPFETLAAAHPRGEPNGNLDPSGTTHPEEARSRRLEGSGPPTIEEPSLGPRSKHFGWISMVLVTEAWRRRGIASFLMARSIEALRSSGHVPGLDATPAGRTVYGPLGFQDIYGLTRFRANRPTPRDAPPGPGSRSMTASDLPAVAALDRAVFGAGRLGLLNDLLARAPDLAWIAEAGDGFCLGRNGRGAWQIGPVVADAAESAIGLLRAALGGLDGPVMIDVPDHHTEVVAWLKGSSFHAERPYTRMLLDRDRPFDDPDRIFAISGPELG